MVSVGGAGFQVFLNIIDILDNHIVFFFFQAEDGIRDYKVTGVQTCALPISVSANPSCPACWAVNASVRSRGTPAPSSVAALRVQRVTAARRPRRRPRCAPAAAVASSTVTGYRRWRRRSSRTDCREGGRTTPSTPCPSRVAARSRDRPPPPAPPPAAR